MMCNSTWQDQFFKGLLDVAHGQASWEEVNKIKCENISNNLKLFRFRPISNDKDLELRKSELKGEIFFCAPDLLNDPYESATLCQNADHIEEGISALINREVRNAGFIGCFNEFPDTPEDTTEPRSLPMWHHYASEYKGCCMMYDISTLDSFWKDGLFPVKYTDNLVDFVNEFKVNSGTYEYEFNDLLHLLIMTHKLKDWSYEHEWRIICDKRLLKSCSLSNIRIIPSQIDSQLSLVERPYSSPREQWLVNKFEQMLASENSSKINDDILDDILKEKKQKITKEPEIKGITVPFCRPSHVFLGDKMNSAYREELIKYVQCLNQNRSKLENPIKVSDMKCDYTGLHFEQVE